MATYPYQGQFGQGLSNPQWGGGKNMQTARFSTTPSTAVPAAGVGPNAWTRELQGVLNSFGMNPANQGMGGAPNGYGGLSPEVLAWIKASMGQNNTTQTPTTTTATSLTPTSTVSTEGAIRAAMPRIQEEQTRNFGQAAKRFGQTGMLASTPYMEALGSVSRNSTNDIASMIEQMIYQANEAQANRALQAGEGHQNRLLQAGEGAQNRAFNAAEAWRGREYGAQQSNLDRAANASNLAYNNWQAGRGDQTALMQLLGDWYMRMREGDENRSLSWAGQTGGW